MISGDDNQKGQKIGRSHSHSHIDNKQSDNQHFTQCCASYW